MNLVGVAATTFIVTKLFVTRKAAPAAKKEDETLMMYNTNDMNWI